MLCGAGNGLLQQLLLFAFDAGGFHFGNFARVFRFPRGADGGHFFTALIPRGIAAGLFFCGQADGRLALLHFETKQAGAFIQAR
jgi:hypothetical protein